MTEQDLIRAEERFVAALDRLMAHGSESLSPAEMAAAFDEDGHLGSEMRAMLTDPPLRRGAHAAEAAPHLPDLLTKKG